MGRERASCTRVDIQDSYGAGLSAVSLPKLVATDATIGNKKQRAVHVGESIWLRVAPTRVDILNQNRASGRAIAPPEFGAVAVVTADHKQISACAEEAPCADVLEQSSSGRRAIAFP